MPFTFHGQSIMDLKTNGKRYREAMKTQIKWVRLFKSIMKQNNIIQYNLTNI